MKWNHFQKYVLQIKYLDIHECYFKGEVKYMYASPKATKPWRNRNSYSHDAFTINIQDERRGKVLRLPFPISNHIGGQGGHPQNPRVLVRCSGPGVSVEDFVEYRGKSEWVEIDSTPITFYMADHQDQFEMLEIIEL